VLRPRPLSLGLVAPGKTADAALTVAAEDPAVLAAVQNHAEPGTPAESAVDSAPAPAAAPVTVSDLAISGSDLTATAEPAPDGRSVVIRVAVSPNASGGAKREQLSFTVHLGDASYKENVPVTAVVTRGVSGPAKS